MRHIMSKLKRLCMATLGVVFAFAMLVMMNMEALAQAEGTVTADSAKIRSEASTTSSTLSSVKSGDKLTITEETTGSDGMVWYKVYVDADTMGYIRSDLIQKGEGSISQSTQTSTSNTQVTPIANQSATVTGNNVRVRDNAGTNGNIVTTIQNGVGVTLTGEATGSDGKKWYQVSFNSNNSAVTGFVRSDFVKIETVTEQEPQEPTETETPEEEPVTPEIEQPEAEEPVEEVPVNPDYEIVYKADVEGEYHWYLNNYIEGKGYKVAELLDAQQANAKYLEGCAKTIKNQKMIIAVLAFLLAALLIVITLMTFKLRDYGYDEEEELDKGKYEDRAVKGQRLIEGQRRPVSQRPVEGQRRPAVQRPAEGQKRPVSQRPVEGQKRPASQRPIEGQKRPMSQNPVEEKKRPASQRPIEGQKRPVSQRPVEEQRRPIQNVTVKDNGWKSKNFLTEDDDEFEFEFLNLENEDE